MESFVLISYNGYKRIYEPDVVKCEVHEYDGDVCVVSWVVTIEEARKMYKHDLSVGYTVEEE